MHALYKGRRPELLKLPIAGGNHLEAKLIPWVNRVLYLLGEEVVLAERGLPELTIQGLDRLRPGTILARCTDPILYAKTDGICYHVSPWGIFDKLASHQHVFTGYRDKEAGEIPFLTEHSEAVWEMILTYYAYTALTDEKRLEAQRRIMRLVEAIGAPRNPHKLEAQLKLIYAARSRDSLNRVLPQVFQASLAGSRHRTDLRIAEIQGIESRFGIREITLTQELARIEQILVRAWKTLTRINSAWKDLTEAKCASWPSNLRDREFAELDRTAGEFNSILVGPFPSPLNECVAEIIEAERLFGKRQPRAAAAELDRASRSVQFKLAQVALHRRVRLPLSLLAGKRTACRHEHVEGILDALISNDFDGHGYPTGMIPRMVRRLDENGFARHTLKAALARLKFAVVHLTEALDAAALARLKGATGHLTKVLDANPLPEWIQRESMPSIRKANSLVRIATRKI